MGFQVSVREGIPGSGASDQVGRCEQWRLGLVWECNLDIEDDKEVVAGRCRLLPNWKAVAAVW